MKILVSEIPKDGLDLDIDEELVFKNTQKKSPHHAHLQVMKDGLTVHINGSIQTVFDLACSRCLDTFAENVDFDFAVTYTPEVDSKEIVENYNLCRDELGTEFYQDNKIDVFELIQEQVTLNTAMKPLCTEDCKGLCKKCGKNLNIRPCNCKDDAIDERWTVLKNIFSERK